MDFQPIADPTEVQPVISYCTAGVNGHGSFDLVIKPPASQSSKNALHHHRATPVT
jgi:hypothetical protein